MGIRLVMESSSRHAPEDLTWRERCVLMILAASAIDATRELPAGIEDNPEIIARLRLGRSERYAVFASLVSKGALERLERGRNGVRAVYAIASFDPATEAARPGDPDAHPVDNPAEGSGESGCFSAAKGPGSANEGSGFDPLKGPGFPDPAPYMGVRDFKTGGKPPSPPGAQTLSPFGLPTDPPEEGESPEAKNPAPSGTCADREALAAEIRKIRPEWSARSIVRALERPSVAERPWLIVAAAMRIMAADSATQHAGRLEYDGPWWPEAARRCRLTVSADRTEGDAHEFEPDAGGDCRHCPLPADSRYHKRKAS
jgi:hypothetical protein